MALQPLSPPLPIPPPPSPSPSGGVGGVGQARGGRQTPTEDLSPRLLQFFYPWIWDNIKSILRIVIKKLFLIKIIANIVISVLL